MPNPEWDNYDPNKVWSVTPDDVKIVDEFIEQLAEHLKSDMQRFKLKLFIALIASYRMGQASWTSGGTSITSVGSG